MLEQANRLVQVSVGPGDLVREFGLVATSLELFPPPCDDLLEHVWDEHADPFTNAVRITVSGLRKRLGEPWIIATVAGAGYRIESPG